MQSQQERGGKRRRARPRRGRKKRGRSKKEEERAEVEESAEEKTKKWVRHKDENEMSAGKITIVETEWDTESCWLSQTKQASGSLSVSLWPQHKRSLPHNSISTETATIKLIYNRALPYKLPSQRDHTAPHTLGHSSPYKTGHAIFHNAVSNKSPLWYIIRQTADASCLGKQWLWVSL